MLLKLKLALLKRHLSQKALARQIGMTAARLSQIIHGHVEARARERQRIGRVVGVPSWAVFPASGRARLRRRSKRTRKSVKARA